MSNSGKQLHNKIKMLYHKTKVKLQNKHNINNVKKHVIGV